MQVDAKKNQSSCSSCSKKTGIHGSVLILTTLGKGFGLCLVQVLGEYLQKVVFPAKAWWHSVWRLIINRIISHSRASALPQHHYHKTQFIRYKAHTAPARLQNARKTTPFRRIFKISKTFLFCIPCNAVYGVWIEEAPSVSMMSHILNRASPKKIKIDIADVFVLFRRKTIE